MNQKTLDRMPRGKVLVVCEGEGTTIADVLEAMGIKISRITTGDLSEQCKFRLAAQCATRESPKPDAQRPSPDTKPQAVHSGDNRTTFQDLDSPLCGKP